MSEKAFLDLMGRLMAQKAVMGPRERPDQPGFHYFDWVEDPEDLTMNYTTTTLPPKKAFFPPAETILTFTLGNSPTVSDCRENDPFVLVGVHPCDLSAIEALDRAYAYPPPDRRWQHNRKRGAIIGVDCLPDSYCFCEPLGISEARKPCDLFLTPIDRGYFVEICSSAGEEILSQGETAEAGTADFGDVLDWRQQKKEGFAAHLDADAEELANILEMGDFSGIWEDIAFRCYSCGSCNTTCPACFCFTMADDFDWTLNSGVRRRTWDSCQLEDFALVAGDHNFRGERWERVRHRWHRKFLYLYRRFGRAYCTGCGRCSRACTADINIVDETNRIISAFREGARRD
ncbi:MAG: 4Fe-4S dicluster domain-containing protein [Desulfatiglandaceae bacterium]